MLGLRREGTQTEADAWNNSFHSELEEGQAGKPSERNKSDSRELGLEKILDRREDGNCDNLLVWQTEGRRLSSTMSCLWSWILDHHGVEGGKLNRWKAGEGLQETDVACEADRTYKHF